MRFGVRLESQRLNFECVRIKLHRHVLCVYVNRLCLRLEMAGLPPLLFSPIGARSAAYTTFADHFKNHPRGVNEKDLTRIVQSDDWDWWHAKVSHSMVYKSVSCKVGTVLVIIIIVECVFVGVSSIQHDCDIRCYLPAATLSTPFAFLTLIIGTLDACITLSEALYNGEGSPKSGAVGKERAGSAGAAGPAKTAQPAETAAFDERLRNERRNSLPIHEASCIVLLTSVLHLLLLAFCIVLYTPGCTSWRFQIIVTCTLLAVSVGLMWCDRWRYKITPLQMVFLLVLLLPSGILLSEELERASWLPVAFLRELCEPTLANATGVSS